MGCGKSTNALRLSELTGAELLEMDEEIVKSQGMEISEIFKRYGEPYFRDLETELIRSLKDKRPAIVSCGGGAVLRPENAAAMRESGTVVLLTAEPETVWDRIRDRTDRPLLAGNMNIGYIAEMMEGRRERYEAAADLTVSTDKKTVDAICAEILARIGGAKPGEN